MQNWWLYTLSGAAIVVAGFIARKNSRETGVSFWRSFFYAVLLILGVTALILSALLRGQH